MEVQPRLFGVDNMKKVLAFGLELFNVGDKVSSGDGFNWGKLGTASELFDEIVALTGVEWSKLSDEWKDMDDAERAELVMFAKQKFDIADDELEAIIEEVLDLVMYNIAGYMKVMARIKKAKEAKV